PLNLHLPHPSPQRCSVTSGCPARSKYGASIGGDVNNFARPLLVTSANALRDRGGTLRVGGYSWVRATGSVPSHDGTTEGGHDREISCAGPAARGARVAACRRLLGVAPLVAPGHLAAHVLR